MMKTIALCVVIAGLSSGLTLYWQASQRPESTGAARSVDSPIGVRFREALSEGDSIRRMHRLGEVFDSMSADQVPGAVEALDRHKRMLAEFEIQMFYEAWARHDPAAALENRDIAVSHKQRVAALEAVIQSWAIRDPEAARIAVEQILNDAPIMSNPAVHALIGGWAYSGQPGLVEWVRSGPEYRRTLGTVSLVAAVARSIEPDELAAWADQHLLAIEDEEFEKELFRRVAKHLADLQPDLAATWVDEYSSEPYATEPERLRLVIERGLPRDPEAVLAWAETFEPDLHRLEIRAAAIAWVEQDFEGAAEFIERTHKRGALTTVHDPILASYSYKLSKKSEFESSVAWAERIDDEQLRTKVLTRTAAKWLRKEPTSADLWLAESPFSEQERESIREIAAKIREAKPPPQIGTRLGRHLDGD